jgi:hypothetical protein
VALAYLAYLLVVVAAPGTLLWRRLTGGSGWFAVDAVLGTGFGLGLEVLIYPLGRWLDIRFCRLSCPPWPLAWCSRCLGTGPRPGRCRGGP